MPTDIQPSEPAKSNEIPKQFVPQELEPHWLAHWDQHQYWAANAGTGKPPHTIMIPLPNVTGALHMGHCLNGTVQDLLTRWRRMQGYEALWMPGTDHAGIATQAVVERRMLEEEKLTRHDIGREALVARIWKWKDSFEARILGQLKRIGASCDWRRVRFTLDEVCSRAVRETFFRMFRDGLIYRGQRLVNWDTYLQTAVADDEVSTEDLAGQFWTFQYPVVGPSGPTGTVIQFSTTRPETMLGDTALCVHPTDERYTHLIGQQVEIPLNGRRIPIIADALLADKELGTGCVKVTPAHDPNDYACGLRNKLPMINILNPDGTINGEGGRFAGLDRYAARAAIVEAMQELGCFVAVEDRQIPMKYSDRSKTPVEPYLSDQWFVQMEDLAQRAIDVVEQQQVQFFPERYRSSYLDWLGEKRDWCISRQLWWGHRIPIWSRSITLTDWQRETGQLAGTTLQFDLGAGTVRGQRDHRDVLFGREDAAGRMLVCAAPDQPELEAALLSAGFEQDPDVLDTWFSSALWPHATLGWPDLLHNPPLCEPYSDSNPQPGTNEVLPKFYPGNVLVTSRDIITLWVARMVLTGLYNVGAVPFQHVHVHPKILDGFGQTMSKSKGNGVDPMDLIDKYGADGVRFTIASLAGETQDVRLPVGYECPACSAVIPQELKHQKAIPAGGAKPRIKCPKCKAESQYTSPWFETDPGQPVARIVSERFEYGRNFCNKLWNAVRFALINCEGFTAGPVAEADLSFADRWILSRLAAVTASTTDLLERYQFDAVTRGLREFVWNEFCDWYLEMIKSRLRDHEVRVCASGEVSPRALTQRVLVMVIDQILRLLHPLIPFITEELWHRLAEVAPVRALPILLGTQPDSSPVAATESVMISSWPTELAVWQHPAIEAQFSRLQTLIVAVRNVRATYNISPAIELPVLLKWPSAQAEELAVLRELLPLLAKAVVRDAGPDLQAPPKSVSFAVGEIIGSVPLAGLIDFAAEELRQQKEAQRLKGVIDSTHKKLSNSSFVDRAPPEVVQEVRETLLNLQQQLASVEEVLRQLTAEE